IASWAVVLVCTAACVRLAPLVCLLEGRGHVESVQRMRAIQAALIGGAILVGLWSGRGIEGAAAAAVGPLLAGPGLPRGRPGALRGGGRPRRDRRAGRLADEYRAEQWRSARVWLAIWAAPQILTPASMALRGATDAGYIGLHVALAFAPQLLSVAWLHGRYPR